MNLSDEEANEIAWGDSEIYTEVEGHPGIVMHNETKKYYLLPWGSSDFLTYTGLDYNLTLVEPVEEMCTLWKPVKTEMEK